MEISDIFTDRIKSIFLINHLNTMKHYYTLFFLLPLFLSCGPSTSLQSYEGIKEIVINPEEVDSILDLSEVLDDSIEIIPLETYDECLIADVKRVEFYKDKIYVLDETNNGILVFDSRGKYQKRIGKQGNGPGEYAKLWNFTFKGDSILVKEMGGQKYIIYDLNSDFYREVPYDVWHFEVLLLENDTIYQISNYEESKHGNYNLFKFDLRTSEVIASYIPYEEKHKNKSGYGLGRYTSRFGDAATLIYPFNDTIYTVRKDTVYPSYVLHFTSRSLPEDVDVNREDFSRYVRRNKFLKGFEYLQTTERFMLGYYVDYNLFKYFLYDKQTSEYKVGSMAQLSQLGGLNIHYFYTTTTGDLVFLQQAEWLISYWKWAREKCSDMYREKMDNLIASLNEDSNPVLFKVHMKSFYEAEGNEDL